MVLFLNKKKLQEQKPLANNTYQGKYDYSKMQYLPEDQRFGFDTLVKETGVLPETAYMLGRVESNDSFKPDLIGYNDKSDIGVLQLNENAAVKDILQMRYNDKGEEIGSYWDMIAKRNLKEYEELDLKKAVHSYLGAAAYIRLLKQRLNTEIGKATDEDVLFAYRMGASGYINDIKKGVASDLLKERYKHLVQKGYEPSFTIDKDGKIIKKENKLSLLQRITPTAEASEVARDTNKKSLWDIFSKKPKMVFPVGEGMSEEETKKAKEILSEEDLAVKGYREGSFFTRPTAGFNDPMASGFLKDIEIAQQTLFSPKSTREEKIEAFNFLMQPIISASQPLESASGKIPTTTPRGKIKSSVLKIFAKDKNPLSIERSLRQMGIDDINAKSLSFDLAKANTADEVGDALVAFSNKPLSIASKSGVDDVASGVAKQATSISDDLAKLKPQTIEPQIAETNLIKEAEILRGTKGMTADDIMATHPNIKLKRDIPATTIDGVKTTIKEGEKLTPYELKGNKILLQDGKTYIVSKNQFQNIKGQSVLAEGKPFAPELEGLEESIKSAETKKKIPEGYGEKPLEQYKAELKRQMPKYENYTLPGGENYKEILIKAPKNFDVPLPSYAKAVQGKNGKWFIEVDGIGKASGEYGTKEDAILGYNKGTISDTAGTFKSSHWDEPNVISHLRLNERTYKGKKVAFMEELQSDWAREGRDRGFSKEITKETAKQQGFTVEKSKSSTGGEAYFIDNTTDEFFYRKGFENTGFNTEAEAWDSIIKKLKETTGAVPNNPLLKNWQELSIKRALKDAVDNNSDYFAWITGEQTSARYNLATHVDNVKWSKSTPKKVFADDVVDKKDIGTHIELKAKGGTQIIINVDKNGLIKDASTSDWNGKKLDEVLGKGLADKIMEKESGTLSGEGLKFGGEWASNLYDRQVKNIVEKLTGQKVEMLDLGLPVDNLKQDFQIQHFRSDGKYTLEKLTKDKLKIGLSVSDKGAGGETGTYIITDILGDGKFKAVPKSSVESPYSDWKEMMKLNPQLENLKETFDISQKTTQQQGIKLTPEVKNKIKGIAPKIKTSGKMFEVKTEEIKSEIPKPAVIQGETFTLGTSKTTQPTIKELKLDLKATQKEIKNAQIAQEKANKLERKEQKIREEAIANLQRFRGNTENIKADLEKRNLSQEDIDNIILEDGTKLNDAIKVKRNSDGSLSDVITKKEIDDLKASYTDEIPKNKWQKRNVLVDGKEVATNAIQSLELPYAYFERKGLSYIYDQVIKSGRDAEVLKNSFIQKFKDADLFKDGSWFTADRFNIDKKEAKAVSEYYLGRQGKTKPVELSSLPEKSQKFIKVFDEIINETTEPFYQMASKMGKQPGVVENYAPLMTSEDIKLIDQGGAQDWLFRKHPAFSALKERVKKAPLEVYEKDYRKVASRWLEGMSQFLEMSETTNHLKYLINSDEFRNIVKESDYGIITKWLQDITTPKTADTLVKKTFNPLSQLLRKGVAMGSLGLNYATVLKQALTQIPIAIIEKSLPKASSEYAKAFGVNVKDLPSISKRKGDIAIQDLQGKISRIFTGGITKFDKMNAQTALNGLLDKEYNKVLKEGVPITKETQNLIEKNAQDKIDMWFGGFFKGQRPEAYREELGNFILMFTYPLTSQTNGFFRHILQAKGFGESSKRIAEVLAAVVAIAYMEKVIENLSPQWSDEKEMTKDTLVSLSGNLPMVGDIVYSIVNDQDINLSPVIGNINNIVRAISKGDGEKIFWTLAETAGLPKQVRRIREGLQIMEEGGITDNNGKMLAPVEGAMEYIRAFLRGKYGPLASKDYIRNVGAKKEDKRWFVPEVEFIQNGDYERKAEIYKTFDRQKKKEFYNMLSEGQQKKLDNAIKGITPKSEGKKSLSDIFK